MEEPVVRFEEFKFYTVQRVVRRMEAEFYTNQVAKDPAMMSAHRPAEEEMDNYLQMTGKYLHEHEDDFDLILMPDEKPNLGRRWIKRGFEPPPS
jgi:hypothetical protein